MLKNKKQNKTGPSSAGLKSVLWVIKCAFMEIHGWKEKYCPEARQTLIFFCVKSATGCTLLSMLLLINMIITGCTGIRGGQYGNRTMSAIVAEVTENRDLRHSNLQHQNL